MSRLQLAIDQVRVVRKYTTELLETIPESDWFRQPAEGVTHVAWQVGHLAFAQYRLALVRVRGELLGDTELIAPGFVDQFGKGSNPSADATQYPQPSEIRTVFERVHEQVLSELPSLPESDLDTKLDPPHRVFDTKLGAILWSAEHEMLHTGQIGLLRRLFQQGPMW